MYRIVNIYKALIVIDFGSAIKPDPIQCIYHMPCLLIQAP